jgi:hypothetical protein
MKQSRIGVTHCNNDPAHLKLSCSLADDLVILLIYVHYFEVLRIYCADGLRACSARGGSETVPTGSCCVRYFAS